MRTLDLQDINIGDAEALQLADELRTATCVIQRVNMVGSAVGLGGLESLVNAFEECNRTVTALNFVTNPKVFFEEWKAHEPGSQEMRQARAQLLCRLKRCIVRNQQMHPRRMQFYCDDIDAYPAEFTFDHE